MLKKNKVSSREYFSYIKRKENFANLTSREFATFLKKLCGTLVHRGKKSYSIRVYNYLLLNLKKKFKKDPTILIYDVANKLMPVFVIGQKQYRGSITDVPVLARGNKKNLYMLNWLVRQLRNKSNIIGVKKQDILKIFADSVNHRSSALSSKKQHDENLQHVKHNLKRVLSHKKLLKSWRQGIMHKERQKEEEANLGEEEEDKINYRESKKMFNIFGAAYLRILKSRVFSKYEKKFIKNAY